MSSADPEPSRLGPKAIAEDEDPSQPGDVFAGLSREPPFRAARRLRG